MEGAARFVDRTNSRRSVRRSRLLSVIIPCFNETSVIQETHKRLTETLDNATKVSFELIFVDDGSRDNTFSLLRDIQKTDQRVRIVAFSRNFGHQIAVSAGIENASGDVVAIIDADLQDPPEIILDMLEKWRNGVDVVYGQRTERKGEGAFKLWTAKAFYRTIARMSDVSIPLDTGDFRLMDRRVIDTLLTMPERDRFVRGMVSWAGFRQEAVPYQRAARFAGTTKYPLKKMFSFATDGIVSFSLVPLRLSTWLGFFASFLAFLGMVYAVLMRLLTELWVPGWTALIIAVLFLGGIQLIFLGVIGEYLGRVYREVKRRPLYVVKARIGFPEEQQASVAETRQVRI